MISPYLAKSQKFAKKISKTNVNVIKNEPKVSIFYLKNFDSILVQVNSTIGFMILEILGRIIFYTPSFPTKIN